MQIPVGSGTGSGLTKMAAFDSALNAVGIANYNIVRLSSIVPPESEIVAYDGKIPQALLGKWGDRMYVVMAEIREDKHNVEAWAGIGWVQDKKTGRGMFTEHEGNSEAFVRREITQSLEALMEHRKQHSNFEWGPIEMMVVGQVCIEKPVCALAAAVFQVSDWDNKPYLLKSGFTERMANKHSFWRRKPAK